jgi:putative spermidine/putrescine transport system permease protein
VDRKNRRRGNLGLAVAALLVALPFLPLFLWSFAGEWRFPDLLPTEWSLRGFQALAEPGSRIIEATNNSLVVGGAATAASVAVGLPAGMALGRYEFRLKGLMVFFILLPILVPPLASTMGVHLTFIRLGLADTAFGVFLVHLVPTVPYTTVILASVFTERGVELEEAARTLGATPWQAFLRVTLPGVAPGVAVAALFAFLVSWSQYILTVLIGGGNVITLPMLLFSAARGSDPVLTSVLALIFVLPAILALVAALRFLRAGDAKKKQEGLVGLGNVS